MSNTVSQREYFEFNVGPHQYVCLEIVPDGRLEVDVCEGPDERDVYQRDVRGYRSLRLEKDETIDFLAGLQAWLEQLS